MGDRAASGALVLAGALFIALALFGSRVHWVEEAGTAERDGYVAQAQTILEGRLPHDPFRPLLYPLSTAGLAAATGDPFAAARTISNLAAAALAWLAFRTGRELGGPRVGFAAMGLLAVNPNLWILGQHATTDMLFAALSAGCLCAALAYVRHPGPRAAGAAGLLFGLAAFTRGNAIFLLPGLLLALAFVPSERATVRARFGHGALAALTAVLGLLPHWVLRTLQFGHPFYDENWKNLAWKLYGYPDWSYLERVPFRGLGEIVRADPGAVLRGGLAEVARFAEGGLAQLVGTPIHAVVFVAASAYFLVRRDRGALWLLVAGGIFVASVAFSFFAWGRFLLGLLPAAAAITVAPLADERWRRERTRDRLALAVLALLTLSLGAKTALRRLPAFVERHPYREVATLRELDRRLPAGAALGGTSPFLDRYLAHRYVAIPDAFGAEVHQPARYLSRLCTLLTAEQVAYLVVSEIDLRDRPRTLLGPTPPAPWFEPAGRGPGVTAWRVRDCRERHR